MPAQILTKRWNQPAENRDGTRIFVARYRPRYLRKGEEPWSEWRKELAPSRELHAAWFGKAGAKIGAQITFEEYARRYHQEMAGQDQAIGDLARRLMNGETITLLCYCADATRCQIGYLAFRTSLRHCR